jgi:hypothetical protein
MSDGEVNQWASHMPSILAACGGTDGPILEAGCGYNSTPHLHALCMARGRPLFTLDGNAEWLARFLHLENKHHVVRHVASWPTLNLDDICATGLNGWQFDVAFVDHDCVPRGPLVGLLRGRARFVVMHDSECGYCGYTDALAQYDWCYTDKSSPAWTTVAGMGVPPPWLADALPGGDWGVPVPYRG